MPNATPAPTHNLANDWGQTPVTHRPCPAWCRENHRDNEHPEDRRCDSDQLYVPLRGLPPIQRQGVWVYDELDVRAVQESYAFPMWMPGGKGMPLEGPYVGVHSETMNLWLSLLPTEARDLAAALVAVADLIEGTDDAA